MVSIAKLIFSLDRPCLLCIRQHLDCMVLADVTNITSLVSAGKCMVVDCK